MGSLAELYSAMGQNEFSRDMLRKMEEAAKESFGEASFERGKTLNALGAALDMTGDKDGAEIVLKEALSLAGFSGSTESAQRLVYSTALFNLGALLASLDRHSEAVENFLAAEAVMLASGISSDSSALTELRELLSTSRAAVSAK
jgi:tetratricopeptide (TPR) repeat protein